MCAGIKRRNFIFVRCDECGRENRCGHRDSIPSYCIKGCVVCVDTREADLDRKSRRCRVSNKPSSYGSGNDKTKEK